MDLNIKKNLVLPSRYHIKCPYKMTPEFIVVHNTANDASAANEVAYMVRNDNKISFHYAVDDQGVVQGVPENRNAWHAGDGTTGNGNRCGIGVEICYSKSGGERFVKAERNAARFIASRLKAYGWGIERVKKHQDFDGKYCPHRTLDNGWNRFLKLIQAELDANKVNEEEEEVKKFNTIEEIPEYGKATVQKLVDAGALHGTGEGLALSEDMLRILVILDRMGKL